MPLTIQVEGINVYGTHGVYDQEKKNGQNFRIDLLIELKKNILNFENYKTESFENTINYENLVNEVINVSDSNSFIQFFANFDNANDAQLTSPFNAGTIFGSLAGSYFTS